MLIPIGNFFFKWRNMIFPLVMLLLIVISPARGPVLGVDENLLDVIGILTILAGEALRIGVIGLEYIKRGGLNKKVYAKDLVTGGFFTVCRNPLYVGNILIAMGLLFIHAQLALMATGIALTLFVYTAIVAAEEHYLRGRFGTDYEAYCQDVNRWFPNLRRLPAAAKGMAFNLERAFVKDYSTLAGAVLWIVVLLSYEHYLAVHGIPTMTWLAVTLIALFTLTVSVMKKAGWLKA